MSASFQPPGPAFIARLRFNEAGLIPAVAQDWLDGAVLMVAWMNREAIERTLASGEVHYWSRSRAELWHKGATSGHTQALRGLRYDCDADVLLLTVEQRGDAACRAVACWRCRRVVSSPVRVVRGRRPWAAACVAGPRSSVDRATVS